MAAGKKYVVTGPYATVKTMTTQGVRVIGLYQGSPLPPDVAQEEIDHLVRVNLVQEEGWTAPSQADMTAEQQRAYVTGMRRGAEQKLAEAQAELAHAKEAEARVAEAHAALAQAPAAVSVPDTSDGAGDDSGDGAGDDQGQGSEPGTDPPAAVKPTRSRAGASKG